MRHVLSWILLLVAAAGAPAQSIHLPATLSVSTPGLVVVVPMDVDADSVSWVAMDGGLQLIPPTLLKDDKTAVGVVMQAGVYRVRALAAKCTNGKAALSAWSECTITVGTPVPPVPPLPPVPPDPPTPVDVLAKAMADAYAADSAADKAANKAKVLAYYRAAATVCTGFNGTAAQLYILLRDSQAVNGVSDDMLKTTRAVVGHAFQQLLPVDPSSSIPPDKAKAAAAVYVRAATILEGLK
jgi:hypothetical protein